MANQVSLPPSLPFLPLLSVRRERMWPKRDGEKAVYIVIGQESFTFYFLYTFLSSFQEHRGTGLPRWNELNGRLSVTLLIKPVPGLV